MPTPLKTTENMTKHLTKAERQAREAAESGLRRAKRPTIKAPEWLSAEARKIFDATKKRMRELDVLDPADTDLLAIYSDAVARYQASVKDLNIDPKVSQAWSRLALSYGEKLGITATGRARLAKKKTDQQPLDDLDALLNDVTDFVNGDR